MIDFIGTFLFVGFCLGSLVATVWFILRFFGWLVSCRNGPYAIIIFLFILLSLIVTGIVIQPH